MPELKPIVEAYQIDERDIQEVTWLWKPYIPGHVCTLIFGKGGQGKSSICCDLAARISSGKPFPFSDHGRAPGSVLFLSAEDEPEVMLGLRLKEAGADFSRLYFAKHNFVLEPRTVRDLKNLVHRFNLAIIFIDPIVSYMGGKRDMNKMNAVREVMAELSQLAKETGITIVVVHHARKDKEGDEQDLAAGSADFVNSVRSTLYVTRTNDGAPIMKHVKHNYSKEGDSLTFDIDEDYGFRWIDQIDPVALLAKTQSPGAGDKAVAFIKDLLSAGPVRATEVAARATDEGIAKNTLNRAKPGIAESFALRSSEGKPTWYWRLKGDTRSVPETL